MRKRILLIPLFLFCFQYIIAQNDTARQVSKIDTTKKLIIGVKDTPPFIIKNANGYSGVSIELWKNIASVLNIRDYEFKEYNLLGLIDALKNRDIDVCINPLTVTSGRLESFDFTQPFYISNLAIAVSTEAEGGLFTNLSKFFSLTINFIQAVSILLFVIFIFGIIIWLVERKKNPEHFAKGIKGIFDGIWWSAVTMTTVGYGDKAPKSKAGRIIATIWMFTAIISISSLTASIAASLTINEITFTIEKIDDLKKVKVGTVKGSSSAKFLESHHVHFIPFNTIDEGMKALALSELEAFVYDEPILRYVIQDNKWGDKIQIIPKQFNSDYYSFSLPHKHPLLQEINPVLIKELESIEWKGILNRYNLEH